MNFNFNSARQFWYSQPENRHFRAKLKLVLWLGALKGSLINCEEKLIYKTLSIESHNKHGKIPSCCSLHLSIYI